MTASSYDQTTWGVITLVAALFFALPFTAAGNFITPKFRNWWASRSISRLQKRIYKLQQTLEELEKYPVMTETEAQILEAVITVGEVVLQLIAMTTLLQMIFMANQPRMLILALSMVALAIIGFLTIIEWDSRRFLLFRSPKRRTRLASNIETLRAELAAKNR